MTVGQFLCARSEMDITEASEASILSSSLSEHENFAFRQNEEWARDKGKEKYLNR